MCSHKVRLLGRKVDNVHDRVIAMGTREFANEVDAYNVPRRVQNGHQVQFAVRFVSRGLRATSTDCKSSCTNHLPAQTGPPVALRNQFEGFELPRMSHDARVVMLLDNPSPKVFVFGDIDLAAKEEVVVFEGPFCASN